MTLPDLFSRRKRLAENCENDVYKYDEIPNNVRIQIIQIITDAVGESYNSNYNVQPMCVAIYENIVRTLRREVGVFHLSDESGNGPQSELFKWFLNAQNIDRCLDFIELTFRFVDIAIRQNGAQFSRVIRISPDSAIAELNARFGEARIGYQYENGEIIRVDSRIIHKEVIVPALKLLHDKQYEAAEQEFLRAHDAYRHRRFEECLVECCKSLESVLKVIGAKRGWTITQTDPAKKLLDAAFNAHFIPASMQAEFSSLRGLLESGVPTIRNKMAGHGAGEKARNIPQHLAAFQLHQTAAAILFLVGQHKNSP